MFSKFHEGEREGKQRVAAICSKNLRAPLWEWDEIKLGSVDLCDEDFLLFHFSFFSFIYFLKADGVAFFFFFFVRTYTFSLGNVGS